MVILKCRPKFCIHDASINDDENGFTVMQYKLEEVVEGESKVEIEEKFVAIGYFLPKIENSIATLEGQWIKNTKRGWQFKVNSCSEEIEQNKDAIIQFLSSGLIKGVGRIYAKRIYEKFGNDTLSIFDNDINRLLEVKGITQNRLEKIKKSYSQITGARETISYLSQFGVSPKTSQKAHQLFPDISTIKENPYLLLQLKQIGFSTADNIALHEGFDMHGEARVKAAVNCALALNEVKGHTGMPKLNLCKAVKRLLNTSSNKDNFVSDKEITTVILGMINDKSIIPFNGNIHRKAIFDCECDVAKEILRLSQKVTPIKDVEEKVSQWEIANSRNLDEIQRKAVVTALTLGFCVITGGPGRGKTTVSKAINDITKEYGISNKEVTLLAPTGRASRRLAESTGESTSTIHKRLSIMKNELLENSESEETIDTEQLLVDEVSMVDIWLCRILLKAVPDGVRVTFVGDPDQLPSVGSGAVLRDIIASSVVPVVTLEKIYRQAEGSVIVDNAEKIRKGQTDLEFNQTDFIGYGCKDANTAARYCLCLYKKAIEKYGIDNVLLLSPFHHKENDTSVDNLNNCLQEMLNPADDKKKEVKHGKFLFREGDMLMQTVNKDGISNGDIGCISSIYNDDGDIMTEVNYQTGDTASYEKSSLDMLELAYAMSVHKSQGCEAPCVILVLIQEHGIMLKRNLVYTAITRASKRFCFVGDIDALNKAINTIDTEQRYTLLAEALKQMYARSCNENNPFV